MGQYNELKAENAALKSEIAHIKSLLNNKADTVSHTEVSGWAKEAVDWAFKEGILQGNDNGLNLSGALTREQMAVLLKRFYDNYVK